MNRIKRVAAIPIKLRISQSMDRFWLSPVRVRRKQQNQISRQIQERTITRSRGMPELINRAVNGISIRRHATMRTP